MTQVRFAQQMPDGTVTIHALAPKADLERVLGPLTDEEYRAHFLDRNGLKPTDVVELPDDWTPPDGDRYFRNAWKIEAGRLGVDMPRAREVHRNKLRAIRQPLFGDLDAAYMRADEAGNPAEKKRIAAEKQALRDVTDDPRIDAARTLDALRAAVPDVLRKA